MAILAAIVTEAQISVNSGTQEIIERSVSQALVKVTRSYVVRDMENGETFKRDGRNDFNNIASLGVMVNGGVIVTPAAVQPWESDPEFFEYRNWYQGVATDMTIAMPDGIVRMDSTLKAQECNRDGLLYLVETGKATTGLELSTTVGMVDGWVVLWTADNDTTVSVTSFRRKVEIKDTMSCYPINRPLTASTILGGVYLEPVFLKTGTVEFRLCGVIVDQDGKLFIAKPTTRQSAQSKLTRERESAPQDNAQRPSGHKLRLIGSKDATPRRK